MLKIIPVQTGNTGSLTAQSDGELVGRIQFVPLDEGTIDLNHTEVLPDYEGRGYGRELVRAAVDFARTNGLKLKASCPFAEKVLNHNPEYQDILG